MVLFVMSVFLSSVLVFSNVQQSLSVTFSVAQCSIVDHLKIHIFMFEKLINNLFRLGPKPSCLANVQSSFVIREIQHWHNGSIMLPETLEENLE